jgi:hypothetical protein
MLIDPNIIGTKLNRTFNRFRRTLRYETYGLPFWTLFVRVYGLRFWKVWEYMRLLEFLIKEGLVIREKDRRPHLAVPPNVYRLYNPLMDK